MCGAPHGCCSRTVVCETIVWLTSFLARFVLSLCFSRRIPQSVWENAIEEVFDGKEEAVPPQWRWNSGICVACAGILQDLCVPVHEVAPTGGGSGGMGKNRKRRHAAMLATTAVTGDGSSTPVANDSAQVPARTAPVILYPCIFPSLCDAVVTSVRSRFVSLPVWCY